MIKHVWRPSKEWTRELWVYSASDLWNAAGRPGREIGQHGLEN